MTGNRLLWVLLLVPCFVGCASSRPYLGSVEFRAAQPLDPITPRDHVSFRVEKGRLSSGEVQFFAWENDGEGCLRSVIGQKSCPTAASPGATTTSERVFWRGTPSVFSVQLLKDGKVVRVQSGAYAAQFALGDDAASQELRAHPELLGMAFSAGLFPAGREKEDWIYTMTTDASGATQARPTPAKG